MAERTADGPAQARPSAGPGDRSSGDSVDPIPVVSNRVLTIPNALSALRLLAIPVFMWLLLDRGSEFLALGVLVVAGISDWLDGRLARAWNQTSRVGRILDPLADRLYILAALAGLTIREIIPWWLAAVIVGRDVLLGLGMPVLWRYGYGPLPVHFLGKAATFNLLYAFPFLLLSEVPGVVGTVATPIGWAFAIWGVGLYWWAGLLYLTQVVGLIRNARRTAASGSS